MAEGFVLNIPQEMLNRLQKADEKIEKLDKNSRRVGENIRLAFMEGAKGVDKFIGSLNSAQIALDKFKDRKINVGLNLDAKAIDDLKKQLSTAGVNIPVGVTGTGSNAGGSNLSNLIAKIDTINQILNQILAQTTAISNKMDSRGGSTGSSTGGTRQTPYTQKQLESLNKKARTALYREELNALQRLTYAEKEKARVERENDKKNQIAHRQRMAELQQQERELRRLASSYRNLPTSIDTKSAGGLIARSKNANTINQRLTAIRNLKNAIKDLDTTDSRYQRTVNHLNKEIRRQEQELAKLGHRMNDVGRRSQNLFNISQQLGRALSLMFSVSQIGQYISKMVNVRKEMELQQRSLQVLLQSKDKANELWNQTLDLAVKSPFRVKELVTYTKQLAAYRIESDKLFETNKMLADVSAGLGVDMQRLILAFGQVKSASFLRGTELRQFTEAGIPMLEELSKYFSEIYGKSVSVAEVFDMISKRMVTFTDVEKVFQRMTGAGGVFFNMQEEQSKTLAGMISNLQDSVDLMMNEMGKKNDGLIKGFVRIAKGLVDNWELIGKISKNILATFLVMKGQIYIMKNLTGEGLKDLKEKIQDIFTLFKSNPWTLAITTVLALLVQIGSAIFKANREAKEFAKTWQELKEDVNQIRFDFEFANDFDEKKAQLENIINLARQKYNLEIDIKIGEVTEENIKDRLEEIEQKIIQLQDNAKSVAGQVGDSGVGHWLSKMGDYYDKFYDSSIKNLSNIIAEMERMENLSDDEVNFLNKLKENKDRRKGESDYQYYERLRDVFVELDKIVDNNDRFSDLGKYYSLKDLQYTYRTFYFDQSIQNLVKRVRSSFEGKNNEDKLNLLDLVIDTSFPKDVFKSLELDYVRKELMYYLSIDDVVQEATLDNKEYLRKWQKDFNQLLSKYNADLGYIEGDRETSKFKLNITSILDNEQGAGIDQKKKLEEVNKELDFQKEKLEDIIIANAEAKKQGITSFYSEEDISHIEDMIKYLTILSNLLGGDDDKSKGGKDTATQRIKDQISLIRQLYEEYQKLSKEMGVVTAKENVLSRFADYANELGLNIDNIDFTTLQGIFDSLQGLETSAESAGADAMKALTKAMGETSVELELMFYIDERKKFESQIEDMFSDYELSLELDKLNIPKNLASDLFGVDTVDLDEIKTALQNKLTELDAADISLTKQLQDKNIDQNLKKSLELQQKGNKQQRESIESNLRKISDMEQKELEERLKTYTKYLLNEQHERVKIRLETLRKLQEVEATSKYTDAQKETITNKLKEEEKESLAKQTWKDFETSPMYMQLFDDIENMSKGALEQMIVTMGGLKTELQSMGLPASDLKEILSQINKVEEELERRNPFKDFSKNANIALNRSKELAILEEQRASQQKDYDYAKASYDNIQASLVENEKILETLDKESLEYQVQKSLVDIILKSTNYWANEVDKAESNLAETNKQINNINDSSNDFYEQLKNIGSITKSVIDGVFQITDAMSWLPEETQLSLERMKGLSDSAFTIAGGIGSIMSGDIIGGITSLISGVSGLVSLFMEWSSGAKEAAIQTEKQGRLLTDLQNKYDRLNKAIDEAWDVAQIKQYNAELQKNLQQQIIAQKAIIEAQKSVKGANDYGSEQWLAVKEAEEELQNLYDTQEELQKNIYSKLTAGIMDDVLSTTESFVDAWYDAFKETGDGLKGLEDSFNEMLLNLVKRQAAMKIAGRFIDEWDKALERYASGGDLSNSEIEYYANKVKNDLPALSSQLEAFFSSFDNVLGDASGNLSGLQRGIQGVTEQQADILASYLNSIKFIVSDSNSQLKALLAAQTSTSASNPIVAQLQVIAQQASAINTLLNSLTAPYQNGGRAFKVVI